jgi:hypothetical protein
MFVKRDLGQAIGLLDRVKIDLWKVVHREKSRHEWHDIRL